MARTRVGVLRGGPSSEYDVSLKTGGTVLANLPPQYEPLDILISKDGVWHYRGLTTTPEKILRQVDVVFNALHGEYGEDGEVQRTLEAFGAPYTGPGVLGSVLSMHKGKSKEIAASLGVKTPRSRLVGLDESVVLAAQNIFVTLHQPLIVKPVSLGSSVGVSMVQGLLPLTQAIQQLQDAGFEVLVEERIKGKEATCGVVEKFRGVPQYVLLPVEIRPANKDQLFDYEAKYSGSTEEICPGSFTREESDELQRLAVLMHSALDLRQYSRSDFMVSPRGIYYLETNSLPGLTKESLFPISLRAVGSSLSEFVDHVLQVAIHKK